MEDIIKIFGGSLVAGIIITALINALKKYGFGWVNILKNTFGALFLFSASVKAIDPLGTAYKMGEYFEELHLGFLTSFSTSFAVIMIVAEMLLGLALILGWQKKWTLWLLFAMNIFFTFLTGYTTVTGKVTDCGCFGDFIKQTPLESFVKDLILVAMLVFIYIGRNQIKQVFNQQKSLMIMLLGGLSFLFFNFSNFYFNKPAVDFRPYAVGKDINAQRIEIPDKLDYGFTFKNKTTGEEKRVTMKEYGQYKKDAEWDFTGEQDNIVLEKGVPAVINNFSAYNKAGEDLTDQILQNEDYSIWILSKKVDESHSKAWQEIKALDAFAKEKQINIFAFSSSVFEEIDEFKIKENVDFPFYQADEVFIKTIIRANPGVLLLKKGKVIGKWHHKHLPTRQEIENLMK